MLAGGGLHSARTMLDARLAQLDARLRAKYDTLADQTDDLADAARAAFAAWQETNQRLIEARYAHAASEDSEKRDIHVQARKRAGTYQPGPRFAATAGALARAEERAAQRLAERDRVQGQSGAAIAVIGAVTALVRDADPADLAPVVVPRPTSATAADLARVRETLAAAQREATVLAHAPVPLPEAAAMLNAFLTSVAADFDPIVLPFALPQTSVRPSPGDLLPHHLAPLLASLAPFREALHLKLEACYATLPASVASADRADLAAKLTERRRALEIEDERLVLGGTGLTRRADADPHVVLTVILAETPA